MGFNRLMKTFDFLQNNVDKMASKLVLAAHKKSVKMCQDVILEIPNVGDFFAWQILCDLLESKILGKITDNQWACLGPGAKNGLRRIFKLETNRGKGILKTSSY